MPDIFISYSRHNMDAANAFAELLRAANFTIFIDYQEMKADHFPARIAEEIQNCRYLLFLVSKESTQSEWVMREVEYADHLKKPILILRLDHTDLPGRIFFLNRLDYIDATRWIASAPIPATASDKLGRALNVTFKDTPARPVAPSPVVPVPTYVPPPQPSGPTFTVAKLGAADFRTITEAIQKVPEGATIKVKPGLYRESVRLSKAVELIG